MILPSYIKLIRIAIRCHSWRMNIDEQQQIFEIYIRYPYGSPLTNSNDSSVKDGRHETRSVHCSEFTKWYANPGNILPFLASLRFNLSPALLSSFHLSASFLAISFLLPFSSSRNVMTCFLHNACPSLIDGLGWGCLETYATSAACCCVLVEAARSIV